MKKKKLPKKKLQLLKTTVKTKSSLKSNSTSQKLSKQKKIISDLKKVQLLLIDSEERYRKLVELSPDAIAVHSEGKFVYVNKAGLELIGAKTEKEIVGKPVLTIVHPDSKEIVKERVKQMGEGKTMSLIEEKFIRLDGTIVDVEVAAMPLIYNGKPSIQVVARDITQRKLLETQLAETDIYYKTLVDASPEGISVVGLDGKIIFASSKLYELWGLPKDYNLCGSSIADWVHPDYHNLTFRRIKKFSVPYSNFVSDEYKMVRYDKSIFWGQVTSTQIFNKDGEVKAILSLTRDITDRKKAEESLREAEYWLLQSQKVAQLGSYVLSFNSGLWTSSEILDQIFGIGKDYERNVEGWSKIIHPEQRKEMIQYFESIIKNRQPFNKEYRIIRENDKIERWVFGLGEFVYNENGSPITMFGTIQDITERKKVQQEIIEAKNKAEKSDRLKSEFLAQMSHEIRTPINIIMNFVSLIKEEVKQEASDDLKASYEIIDSASRRIIRTIDLILNMSEVQTGTYEPSKNLIDINKNVLDRLYNEYKNYAERKNLDFSLRKETGDTQILLDEYSTTQIFANLIDNAVKYTNNGKVEILVRRNDDKKLVVEVKDTGIGISEDFLPLLFESFAQEEHGYTRKFDGNGLGLALVKNYCEMNDARVEVHSTKGIGSAFRVIFN